MTRTPSRVRARAEHVFRPAKPSLHHAAALPEAWRAPGVSPVTAGDNPGPATEREST
jgi:hypothetical protein